MSTGGTGHTHRFDPVSGWCSGCTLRDDGRLIDGRNDKRSGRILQPGASESNDRKAQVP